MNRIAAVCFFVLKKREFDIRNMLKYSNII